MALRIFQQQTVIFSHRRRCPGETALLLVTENPPQIVKCFKSSEDIFISLLCACLYNENDA
jgi:hypothetical protein